MGKKKKKTTLKGIQIIIFKKNRQVHIYLTFFPLDKPIFIFYLVWLGFFVVVVVIASICWCYFFVCLLVCWFGLFACLFLLGLLLTIEQRSFKSLKASQVSSLTFKQVFGNISGHFKFLFAHIET